MPYNLILEEIFEKAPVNDIMSLHRISRQKLGCGAKNPNIEANF
jgi:hypothetical protein